MLTQEQAEAIIAPYKGKLYECMTLGVADYGREYSAEVRAKHSGRTVANIRRDHIIARVKESFEGVPDTAIVEVQQLVLLTINGGSGTLAIRFNKADEDGRCRGNPTAQTALFNNQQPIPLQEELSGISPSSLRLIGTYELNTLGTAAIEPMLGCPRDDGAFVWSIALPPPRAEGVPVKSLPERRAEKQPEKKTGQVRGRTAKSDKKASKDDDANG
jgi:hypothetical protein